MRYLQNSDLTKLKGGVRNMTDLTNKFEQPTTKNVEVGDLLLRPFSSGLMITPVVAVLEDCLIGRPHLSSEAFSTSYENAVVLKNDGRYLVGESVPLYGKKTG